MNPRSTGPEPLEDGPIRNPFPPPPRHTAGAIIFFSVLALVVVMCGYLVWQMVADTPEPMPSKPSSNGDAESTVIAIAAQLEIFQKSVGRYPTQAEGLQALVERPATLPEDAMWAKLRKDIPSDPWGGAYQYEVKGNPPRYRVYSRGPNPIDPADDIEAVLPPPTAPAKAGPPKFRAASPTSTNAPAR